MTKAYVTSCAGVRRFTGPAVNRARSAKQVADCRASLAHNWVYALHRGASRRLWIERIGWMTWDDFFRKQGVVEASNIPFSNPISISGAGTEVVGGIFGASFSWLVNMNQVFVCERGNSIQTGFPNGLRAAPSLRRCCYRPAGPCRTRVDDSTLLRDRAITGAAR